MKDKLTFFLSHPRAGNVEANIKDSIEKEKELKKILPYEIFNPLSQIDQSLPEPEAMKQCIKKLLDSEVVVFCKDWENSRGCSLENQVAKATGKLLFYLNS